MDYKARYQQWLTDKFFNESIHKELLAIADEKEIEDRFYRDLEFGTGGVRGLMGAGTNRMNKYTVGRVTKGFGDYLIVTYGIDDCAERGIVIGYDTRNNSEYFAKTAADILSGMGIRIYLHAHATPTPQLSFSVKFWNAMAGIMITASHNPKEYNGYKVYDEYGSQLVPCQARQVISCVNAITDYHTINFDGDSALTSMADITDNFVAAVLKQERYSGDKSNLRVVYTPLHGTGNVPVQKCLRLAGFTHVDSVVEQSVPDGDFPTVASPNPEDRQALEMGIAQAERIGADIVLGTDPDSDRVGVAVKVNDGYKMLTGNQIGALLMDYVLSNTDIGSIHKPAAIKTVVTSELGAEIAKKYGLTVFSTLTGFKFIGEKITQFEQARETGDSTGDYTFLFGYEESCGYLAGTHARDKDAVVSSLLICEMAAFQKTKGKTLLYRMNELYATYGYYKDALDSFTLKGKDGLERIKSIMVDLKKGESPFENTIQKIDYSIPVDAEYGFGKLPTSDVVKYILADGSWIAVRPSGTEPKIKIYYSIKDADQNAAENRLQQIQSTIKAKMNL